MEVQGEKSVRRRMSDVELRRKMLDAAKEMIDEAGGLTVGLEHLSYEAIIQHADSARSSAYRLWPAKDDFYVELLCDLAGPHWKGTAAFDQATIDLAGQIVAEHLADLHTEEGRRQVMREAVRRSAAHNYRVVVNSTQWRTYVALTATLLSLPEQNEVRQRVQAALQLAERGFIDKMAKFYEDMAVVLGFRLKSPYHSFATLAAAGAAVIEGLGLRQTIAPTFVDGTFALSGPHGPEDWTLPAIGFMAILDEFVEPTPEYSVDVALAEYFKRKATTA